ncbi:NRDE family protein [Nannocystis punicea]|uniref:NRDE family protein n=1 Tax=Nannocystis punicea TaxID=2995304 RepID=A0ABY7GZT7_9BACT|nr:NRDE family protein [Nannocystis poenicansa]WAS92518.1 NRDE family protein [Nannocystis poenicansa]
MCTLLFALGVHPRYSLVLAANRDEFYARKTAPAGWWRETPALFAGRDLQAGGTWFGVTRGGRWAALTNVRDPSDIRLDVRSRGELVADYLRGAAGPGEYVAAIAGERYAGFNLVCGDPGGVWYMNNKTGDRQRLGPGVYGISNAALDTPWPKVVRGKSGLSRLLTGAEIEPEAIMAMLADATPATDAELPDTGVGLELERALSPLCIAMPGYGTRVSTAMLVASDGWTLCREQATVPGPQPASAEVKFRREGA